ncbi:MAG: 2-C-methyl-D-erythritol 4-phosphate cytidylyltransferase [Ignavibacteriales bacterium]|nr:2-C-methyl-D-erythritol 4-phosphate cytidylyltransferase [Ignavibacteriales bacterium]
MKVYAIIPSGGKGIRANTAMPKQYLKFHGKELIAYSIEVFQRSNLVDEIIIAAQNEFFELLDSIKKTYGFTKLSHIIEGGAERQYSVFNALNSLECSDEDIIIVHDAVRPLLPQNLLVNSIQTAKEFGSAVVAIKAKDTLIKGKEFVESYIDRKEIYYAQTPQVFKYKIIIDAFRRSQQENFLGTDESMLVKRAGYNIKIVEGSTLNFKITTDDDIKLFEMISKPKL